MAALLRCPVLARNPRLLRALGTAPPRPHPEDAFPYEALLGARLAGLRRSHTYREFAALARRARDPPSALLGTPPRLVQLWCSNDYLGMSRHPEVLRAARWVLPKPDSPPESPGNVA
ncbi:unnamed protein product [Coccothraustes coccothraustes]